MIELWNAVAQIYIIRLKLYPFAYNLSEEIFSDAPTNNLVHLQLVGKGGCLAFPKCLETCARRRRYEFLKDLQTILINSGLR